MNCNHNPKLMVNGNCYSVTCVARRAEISAERQEIALKAVALLLVGLLGFLMGRAF